RMRHRSSAPPGTAVAAPAADAFVASAAARWFAPDARRVPTRVRTIMAAVATALATAVRAVRCSMRLIRSPPARGRPLTGNGNGLAPSWRARDPEGAEPTAGLGEEEGPPTGDSRAPAGGGVAPSFRALPPGPCRAGSS